MADILNCEERTLTGSRNMRRLRASGYVPAILYGRGEPVSLQVARRDIDQVVHHGSHVVTLGGAMNESALIKEVQWDAFGDHILHVDFYRIKAGEVVDLEVTVTLVGEAPGTHSGGVVRHLLHEIEIKCPADKMPDHLELRINDLELGQALTAADVPLPEGASLVTPSDQIVVQCVEAQEAEETEATEGPAEPEVIGKRESDDEANADES